MIIKITTLAKQASTNLRCEGDKHSPLYNHFSPTLYNWRPHLLFLLLISTSPSWRRHHWKLNKDSSSRWSGCLHGRNSCFNHNHTHHFKMIGDSLLFFYDCLSFSSLWTPNHSLVLSTSSTTLFEWHPTLWRNSTRAGRRLERLNTTIVFSSFRDILIERASQLSIHKVMWHKMLEAFNYYHLL